MDKIVDKKFEKVNANTAKVTVTVTVDEFHAAEDRAYNKRKNKFNIPGFRKGHSTKDMIFKVYGRDVFFEDAVNDCINETYYEAVKDCEWKVLSRPIIDVDQVDADKELIYNATFAIAPDFKVAKYKGIEVKKENIEVTEDDIKAELVVEQEKNTRLVTVDDRAVKDGDVVTINFEGFIDGTPFKGGKGDNYPLTIGSHSFIDNFEEQLIGHNINDEVDVNVKFPDNYGEKSLAGKPALFKVKILEIKLKEVPELNDEFASEVSEFDKLDDYKNSIKEKLLSQKNSQAEQKLKQNIVDEIVKNTDINLSDEAIDEAVMDVIRNIERRLQYQRVNLDDYLKMTGQTFESLKSSQRDAGISNLKTSLVLDEIAKLEDIKVSDEKVEKQIEDMAKMYGMPVDKFKSTYMNEKEIENMKNDLLYPTVVDFLFENAKIK